MASKRVKRLLKEAFVSADGDTVTIATSRFLALLDAEKRLAAGPPRPARYPRSPIDLNPKMVKFITSRLGRMHQREIVAEAAQVFGAGQLTKSALGRFVRRIQAGQAGFTGRPSVRRRRSAAAADLQPGTARPGS